MTHTDTETEALEAAWACTFTKGGRDPELADGCDAPGEYIQDGRWVCQAHIDPDLDATYATYEA